MLLSKNTLSNSCEPGSSKVGTSFVTEPEEQSVSQGSEQISEAESQENTTDYSDAHVQ